MQGEDEEVDALDAFMAGIQTEVAEDKAAPPKPPVAEVEEVDEYDAVADYMEAQQRRRSGSRSAQAVTPCRVCARSNCHASQATAVLFGWCSWSHALSSQTY